MKTHTPGPWKATRCDDRIMMCHTEGDIICESWMERPQEDADFALIAAAPDLLEELRYVVDYNRGGLMPLDLHDWLRRAEVAILKAEGKQTTSQRGDK